MGLDWIPCRLEPDVDRDSAARAVDEEFQRFCAQSGWVHQDLWPLAHRKRVEPPAKHQIEDKHAAPASRVCDLLLLKFESHRVAVISGHEILPLEFRIEAYRTILPGELAGRLEAWVAHRDAVAAGRHREYLNRLLHYLRSVTMAECFEQMVETARLAQSTTASWAQRPELIEAREAILAVPPVQPAEPPRWHPQADNVKSPMADDCWPALSRTHDELCRLGEGWNRAARRGNRTIATPPKLPSLDDWIARWLDDDWFPRFTQWLEPWIVGRYGLYRDCE